MARSGHADSQSNGRPRAGRREEEGGGLFAADNPRGELLTALPSSEEGLVDEFEEEEDFVLNLSIDDDDAPIKAQNAIMNAFGEPVTKRRVSRHGPASTHTPDFAKMTMVGRAGRGQDSLNKPFDDDYMKSPFKEAQESASTPPRLTVDLVKTLGRMTSKIGISKQTLLSESGEESDLGSEDQNGEA